MYVVANSGEKMDVGLGSLTAGVLGSMPLPPTSPIRLAAQVALTGGTAGDQINTNAEDGYNYFETRTGFDFTGRTMESLVLGKESLGFKLHLNQGAVIPLGSDHDNQLLIGGGIQVPVHRTVVLGLELNSRTGFSDVSFSTDPLWLTPCVHFRIPSHVSLILGMDITLSQERKGGSVDKALEPFRIFGGAALSFDALARRRKAAADRERAQVQEKDDAVREAAEAQARADDMARKAREDSLAREAERVRADSLARKMREDSIALAETKARLADEISKRSDAEKQLLSTGLLLLDAVYFRSGKSAVEMNSRPYLKIIARMLTKYPKLQIEIAGHTDNTGKMQSNMLLSQARAQAVRLFLVDMAPELSDRLVARGYGPTQPKADNNTADGRKVNRRVELQVLNKDVLKEYNP
jgi:outer membrane protein OmpA-like peptidoglycan-associated protein